MLVFNKYFYKKEEVKVVLWRPCRCPKRLYLPNRREYNKNYAFEKTKGIQLKTDVQTIAF
jgi:hypothetical protein